MDPHGHSKPTRRIRALGFSLPIMMHLVGVECNVSLLTNLQQYLCLPLRLYTTSAVAERNRLFNFVFCRSSTKRSKSASSVPKTTKKKKLSTWSHDFVCLWSTTTTKPMEGDSSGRVDPLPKLSTARKRRLLAVLTRSCKPDILFLLHARTVCTVLARCSYVAGYLELKHWNVLHAPHNIMEDDHELRPYYISHLQIFEG